MGQFRKCGFTVVSKYGPEQNKARVCNEAPEIHVQNKKEEFAQTEPFTVDPQLPVGERLRRRGRDRGLLYI